MRLKITLLLISCLISVLGKSQNIDSLALQLDTIPKIDSTILSYINITDSLSENLIVSDSIDVAMTKYLEKNKNKKSKCFRLRIFLDNSQNAREVSKNIADEFLEEYPECPLFRTYSNPYWRVTVGEFRAKSDALKFMDKIRKYYPSSFVVRESFSTN